MNSKAARIRRVIGCLVLLLLSTSVSARTVRVGLMESAFVGTNSRDAHAALEVWVGQLRKLLPDTTLVTVSAIYKDRNEVLRDLVHGRLDAISLPTMDYFAMRDHTGLKPVVASVGQDGKAGVSYVLVRRAGASGIGIKSLEEGMLLVPDAEIGELATLWLDNHLKQNGHAGAERFFDTVKQVTNASQAAMAVFFSQADACLITERSLNTMVELNPQMGRDLEVVVRSEDLVPAMLCLREGLDKAISKQLLEAVMLLPEIAEGRQALALFKQTDLKRMQGDDLGSAERLIETRDRFLKELVSR